MRKLSRRTLAERAEEQLAEAIAVGELAGKLPGHRELCRIFGISRTSLEPALEALVARGILISRGPRRRFEVAAEAARRSDSGTPVRKVLLLEPTRPGRPTPVVRRVAADLSVKLQGSPWALSEHYTAVDQRRSAGRRFETILETENPDFTILVGGHSATIDWFLRSGVPFGCFGGDVGDRPIPFVAYDVDGMLDKVLSHFLAAGCRDPFIPLRVRTQGMVEKVRHRVGRALGEIDQPFSPEWHTPILRENNAEALREAADKRLLRSTPDVWICFGYEMLIGTLGQLSQHGLKVPQEVSLALLGPPEDLPWLPPWIGAFEFPTAPVTRHLMRWLHHGGRNLKPEYDRVHPRWKPGRNPPDRAAFREPFT